MLIYINAVNINFNQLLLRFKSRFPQSPPLHSLIYHLWEKNLKKMYLLTYPLFLKWANSYLVKLFNKDGLFALHVVHISIVRNSEKKNGFLKERKKKNQSLHALKSPPQAISKAAIKQASTSIVVYHMYYYYYLLPLPPSHTRYIHVPTYFTTIIHKIMKISFFFQSQSMFGQPLPTSLLPCLQHSAQLLPPG